jgi:hypothetical protein
VLSIYAEGSGWILEGDADMRSRFWGRSIEVLPVGVMQVTFKDGEVITFNKVRGEWGEGGAVGKGGKGRGMGAFVSNRISVCWQGGVEKEILLGGIPLGMEGLPWG